MIEGTNELAMVQNGNMSLLMVKILERTIQCWRQEHVPHYYYFLLFHW